MKTLTLHPLTWTRIHPDAWAAYPLPHSPLIIRRRQGGYVFDGVVHMSLSLAQSAARDQLAADLAPLVASLTEKAA